ncbi:MAG: hypothetical protein U1E22_04905 [Coriobacteriia bacterium]|nr:hypothetical protein [Coriobacteriia bacterium]
MRTRVMRLGVLACALMVLAALFPGLASADVLPVPPSTLPTPTPTPVSPAEISEQPPEVNQDFRSLLYSVVGLAEVFLVPLLLTIAIETPILVIAGRGSKASWKAGILVNTLTNPVAVLVVLLSWPILIGGYGPADVVLVGAIEIAVVVVEWRVFRWVMRWSNRRAIITSLVANVLSFGIGLALLGGW